MLAFFLGTSARLDGRENGCPTLFYIRLSWHSSHKREHSSSAASWGEKSEADRLEDILLDGNACSVLHVWTSPI